MASQAASVSSEDEGFHVKVKPNATPDAADSAKNTPAGKHKLSPASGSASPWLSPLASCPQPSSYAKQASMSDEELASMAQLNETERAELANLRARLFMLTEIVLIYDVMTCPIVLVLLCVR